MAIQLKWPILGVIIPCILIAGIGYGAHFFVFSRHMSLVDQIWFQVYMTMVWISYILAIVKDPGSPPKNFQPNSGEWRRWCKKCQNYKPERTHHCKTCNKCVLKMDHHCPWTYNCVGHGNIAHFLRFLLWVIFTTGITFVELSKRAVQYYKDSDLPSYLISKSEMFAVIFLLPVDFFVLASITVLLIRCVKDMFFMGMTQIEGWEMERIESQFHTERMWARIRRNYYKLHGKELPRLTSWNRTQRYYENTKDENTVNDDANDNDQSGVPEEFTTDDLIFPYDRGLWKNIIDSCGMPWTWILPWGGPSSDGYHFDKTEFMDEDQLGLPWPPDGGHQDIEVEEPDVSQMVVGNRTNIKMLKKRLDPRSTMKRTEWRSDAGETLDDLGVDVEAEDEDELMVKVQ
ncbi:zinc finger family protein [Scheffersomyces stipitis CBS 6054]|uniref:Palmitoyltransferase PFA4 n=1 Tax=Scheffersomyces stipitis (strain ATCC 58785 / CBS 6054 / NBRC 10063 / NRRL Y-11545) TaxID=322104 RepID=A3LY32_PICST|nr:zinc finger family protein [Scheffersomyces stipitis CBS 6054]ABN67566.2 zinc finger family protein [Scheffersomyces stipitis CBS 6054]